LRKREKDYGSFNMKKKSMSKNFEKENKEKEKI